MDNPKVKAYFQTLDVDVHEGGKLDVAMVTCRAMSRKCFARLVHIRHCYCS